MPNKAISVRHSRMFDNGAPDTTDTVMPMYTCTGYYWLHIPWMITGNFECEASWWLPEHVNEEMRQTTMLEF